ncbi:MAG TPA: hypothetical protein VLA58_03210, partial [Chitinophagaceae bacterium]|nr:hypothetical protein [Chitinophagaceae bacterium]
MSKRLWFISILCLLLIPTLAQEGFIHAYTDQQIYIAGEKIWISGKKSGNPPEQKEPVRVYLFDRTGNLVERVTAMNARGDIGCYIQLQGTVRSDSYLVAVSSSGYKPRYIPVAIVNPIIPPVAMNMAPAQVLNKEPEKLMIRADRDTYDKRELVKLTFDTTAKLDLQVSVARKDLLSDYVDSLFDHWSQPELQLTENLIKGEGQQVKVGVYNSSNQLVPGVRVFASVLGDQANIATAVSDQNGMAYLSLPYPYGDVSLVLSAHAEQGQPYRLQYEDPGVQIRGSKDLPALQLDERFRTSVNERLLNAEVSNKYRPEAKIRYLAEGLDTTDFYGKPDMRYMLDDYTRIPNMEEILFEYIQQVRVRRQGEKPAVLVFNTPFKTFFELPAMVLLDGVPVSDLSQLLALDPLQLKSVDVVARKFLLDEMQLPGIVHYKSYKADLGGYKLPPQDIV